jgi:SAM-dependent methyltransferase
MDRPMSWEDAVRWLIARPDRQDLVRDCYFDPPLAAAADRYRASGEWAAARAFLPRPPGRALDLGAGNGIVSAALAGDGWTVAALEPDPSALVGAGAVAALSAERGLGVAVVRGWGEALPFRDGAFDAVVCRQVLHHAADLPGLCREIARVLRPGGRLLALRDHVVAGPGEMEAFFAVHPLHALYGGENAFTEAQYLSAFRGAGLSVERRLRSFDSPVNLAPRTSERLWREIGVRLAGRAGGAALAGAMRFPGLGAAALRLLSAVDRRPGRLFSFVCAKPAGG